LTWHASLPQKTPKWQPGTSYERAFTAASPPRHNQST